MHLERSSILSCVILGIICLSPRSFAVSQSLEPHDSSSTDIMVADGLQLPNYGVMWILERWKGVDELVQLGPSTLVHRTFSIGSTHPLEIAGEAARVRVHQPDIEIFVRGISSDRVDSPSEFVLVRLFNEGNHRRSRVLISNGAAKHLQGHLSADFVPLIQNRMGTTDWYRLSPKLPLTPDEYAIVPLSGAPSALSDGIRDFAFDPSAPENSKALTSDKNRGNP